MNLKNNLTIAALAAMVGVPAAVMNHANAHADQTNDPDNVQSADQNQEVAPGQAKLINNRLMVNRNQSPASSAQVDSNVQNAQPNSQATSESAQPATQGDDLNTDQLASAASALHRHIVSSAGQKRRPSVYRPARHTEVHSRSRRTRSTPVTSGARAQTNYTSRVQQAVQGRPTAAFSHALDQTYRGYTTQRATAAPQAAAGYNGTIADAPAVAASRSVNPGNDANADQSAGTVASPVATKGKQRSVDKPRKHRDRHRSDKKQAAAVKLPNKQKPKRSTNRGADRNVAKLTAMIAIAIAAIGIGFIAIEALRKKHWNRHVNVLAQKVHHDNADFHMNNDNMNMVSSFDKTIEKYMHQAKHQSKRQPNPKPNHNPKVSKNVDKTIDAYFKRA